MQYKMITRPSTGILSPLGHRLSQCCRRPLARVWSFFTCQRWSHRRSYSSRCDWKKNGTLDDIVKYINDGNARNIVVMAGAGISTPSGIPDFRSPGTGLYDNLQKYNLPYPEAVFDIGYFTRDPRPFYALAHELYPKGEYRPNISHYMVRLLHNKGLLSRMYTQNIDGLERLAGLPSEKLVEAHGGFYTATCRQCQKKYKGHELESAIFEGRVAQCTDVGCQGVIKPDIVFFGEQLPTRFWLFNTDMPQADLLIVMGTSLEVQPFASISEEVLPGVPRLLFNKEATGPFVYSPRKNDVVAAGNMTRTVSEFCEKLGWAVELDELMKKCENEAKHKRKNCGNSEE